MFYYYLVNIKRKLLRIKIGNIFCTKTCSRLYYKKEVNTLCAFCSTEIIKRPSEIKEYNFCNSSCLPYKYEILKEISDKSENIWKIEKELHKIYNKYKYKPLKNFGGETECFTLDCLEDLYSNIESILIEP